MAPEHGSRRRRILSAIGVLVVAAILVAAGYALGVWGSSDRETEHTARLSALDTSFAQEMSAHHQQAVLLGQTLDRGVDPQVRALADQIITAQTSEIATMQGWLTLVDAPLAAPVDSTTHEHMHTGNGPAMPGMASIDDIGRLSRARGADAETLFLQLMIRHHQGGVDMAQSAYNNGLSGPVGRVALGMIGEQGNEIGLMTAMLSARGKAPLDYP